MQRNIVYMIGCLRERLFMRTAFYAIGSLRELLFTRTTVYAYVCLRELVFSRTAVYANDSLRKRLFGIYFVIFSISRLYSDRTRVELFYNYNTLMRAPFKRGSSIGPDVGKCRRSPGIGGSLARSE